MNSLPLKLKPSPLLLGTVLVATAIAGGVVFVGLSESGWTGVGPVQEAPSEPQVIPRVSALGRLEPSGEIIQVAAPLTLDGDRLAELRVDLGDFVQTGQPIAVLDSQDRLQDEVVAATLQVQMAEARLAQVKAGAKSGAIAAQAATVDRQSADLEGQLRVQRETIARIEAQYEGDRTAQTATVNRLKAELKTAEAELERYRALFAEGAVSASTFDSNKLSADTTRQALQEAKAVLARTESTAKRQIKEAKAELARLETTGQAQIEAARSTLDEVAEVRPVDVQMVQVELNAAKANLVRANNNLSKSVITAPRSGQILEVYTRPGEQMSSDGIVALGQTNRMLAIAEVYQSDISRVRLGQTVSVTGQAFDGELTGKVIEIGRQISRQSVFSGQPGENLDRRVVEVKVALAPEDSQKVSSLSNLQVQAIISTADES
ncbi:MAG: HlyD family efflux transporter periplasmic adaptor subunit [Cyanobacteria bacterium P01_F01_bin.42]